MKRIFKILSPAGSLKNLNRNFGYLSTLTINKSSNDRTDLKWAYNYEWASQYTKELADWASFTKLTVSFEVVATSEFCKIELLDYVEVTDSQIKPNAEDRGLGWVVRYSHDPKTSNIKLDVMFDPAFLRNDPVFECREIVEQSTNTNQIIEQAGNSNEIIEYACPTE